jgi:small conductance mechanosensitive channel
MELFFRGIVTRLRDIFDLEAMGASVASLTTSILVALITLAGFLLLWRIIRMVTLAVLDRTRVDETNRSFVLALMQFGLFTVAIIQTLSVAGINVAALAASVGIAGLTLGFAARDSLSNIISGVMIFWDRPFVIDDLVEIGEHYGRVERITLRSTRIVTVDGRMLAVPNTAIVNTIVASYTNFPNLRIDVPVTVGTAEDLGRVRRLLLELVRDSGVFLVERAPVVVVKSINDYNVELELRAWIINERDHVARRTALREAVFEQLRNAGVEMPCELLALKPIDVRQQAA